MSDPSSDKSASPGSPPVGQLKDRTDTLARMAEQLQKAHSAQNVVRTLLVLLVLAIVVGHALYTWRYAQAYGDTNRENLVAQLMRQFTEGERSVVGEAIPRIKTMADEVAPVYRQAFHDEFVKKWPEIKATIEAEADTYKKTVETEGTRRLQSHLHRIAKDQEQMLIREFPELKSPAKRATAMKNLEAALQWAAADVLEEHVNRGEQEILEVYTLFLDFVPEDRRQTFAERMKTHWQEVYRGMEQR